MRGTLRMVSLLTLLSLLPACVMPRGGGGGRWEPGEGATQDRRATLRVENRSWNEVVVYAIRSTQRIRLGNVPGVSTRTFNIPESLVGGGTTLRFQADPIGSSQAPVSHEITVNAGDQVQLYVPPS